MAGQHTPSPLKPRPKGRIRRWLRRLTLSLLIALLLATAPIVGGAVWLDTALHRRPMLAEYLGRPEPGRGSTWLIIGSDNRDGLTDQQQGTLATGGDLGSSRTDTILLVHLPGLGSSTRPTMVSIPRDSDVPIPGHDHQKINAAYAIGGPPLLAQTVEQATGLRLDHVIEIGFGGFAGLVDALGGISACPAAAIDDPLAGIDLPAGCQTLTGQQALGYVRTRATPRADLDRMVNQRLFMSALLQRASTAAVWRNPARWYSVPRAVVDALTVDDGMHAWDLARLGWALHGPIVTTTVPIAALTTTDAGAVVVWDQGAARQLFDALATDVPVPSAGLDG